MFLPIGDEPNARAVPIVNYALIAVNVAVFALVSLPLMGQPVDPGDPLARELLRELARQYPGADPRALLGQLSAYDVFLVRWGYRAAEPSALTLLTAMFLHGGWLHLVGNMLFLWIYGDNVEHRLGRLGYVAAYLAAGVAATLGYAAVLPDAAGGVPMVGASGAISGVLGFYFVWFPRNRVRLLIVLLPFYVDVWSISARVVLAVYVVIDNLLPFLLASADGGGVAYGAHLGGFLAGAAGGVVLDRWTMRRRRDRGHGDEPRPGDLPADARGVIARAERDPVAALQAYHALAPAERRRVPPAVAVDLADWLLAHGSPDAALGVYHQVLSDHRRGPGPARGPAGEPAELPAGGSTELPAGGPAQVMDRALLGMGLASLQRGEPVRAYQYLSRALATSPSPAVAEQARRALQTIAEQQKLQVRRRRWPRG